VPPRRARFSGSEAEPNEFRSLVPLQIALAAISTAAFIAAGAVCSLDWADRAQILESLRLRKEIVVPQGRAILGLAIFGIVAGIPAALGLVPGLILVPLAGLLIVNFARVRLNEDAEGSSDARWLAVLGISAVSLATRFDTLDTGAVQGAQSVLGPSVLIQPAESALLTLLALAAGLVSALFVGYRAKPLPEQVRIGVDPVLRWGETALAASLITAAAAGPSIAVVGDGPLDLRLGLAVAASFLFGLACTAGVSYLRRHAGRLPERPLLLGCAAISSATLMLQLLLV
jgi:hypothetical protein